MGVSVLLGYKTGSYTRFEEVSEDMFLRDKDKPMASKILMMMSVASVVLSAMGAFGYDLYLASTQWLLVAVVMAVWGVYLLLEAEFRS